MRSSFIFVAITLFALTAAAQTLDASFYNEVNFRKTGMTILGSWAVANIASGLVLRNNTTGTKRYFHEMNALWNSVNLGIAALGYYGAATMVAPEGVGELYNEQMSLDKTLLFNAGLDLAYMAGGLYMIERSRRGSENSDRWRGYGQSVILQGAFLFTFDVLMVVFHKKVDLPAGLSFRLSPGAPDFIHMAYAF